MIDVGRTVNGSFFCDLRWKNGCSNVSSTLAFDREEFERGGTADILQTDRWSYVQASTVTGFDKQLSAVASNLESILLVPKATRCSYVIARPIASTGFLFFSLTNRRCE